MSEKTHHSLGSYKWNEVGAVQQHAKNKGLQYETYAGPMNDRQLADGTRLTVAEGMIAVILITSDVGAVHHFWDDFVIPEQT